MSLAATGAPMTELAARVQALETLFAHIAATRMVDVPVCHPALWVQAVGFEALPGSGGACGVLVTPWFMNLVWLPLGDGPRDEQGRPVPALRVGATRVRAAGPERFEFIGAHEDGFGPFEACSLFSPMFEFADQAAAVATAEAVLTLLRPPPPPAAPEPEPVPPRRRFLLGAGGARA